MNKATAEAREKAEAGGELPLDFMLKRMRDDSAPMVDRMDMAKAAAPYIHAKLSSIEASGPDGGALQIIINKPA